MDLKHEEYSSAIASYKQFGETSEEGVSMHGPAVASLLVGKNCGVATESRLHYSVSPGNWDYYSDALDEIVSSNEVLEDKDKIKIVSCSIGYPNPDVSGNLDKWKKVIKKAKSSGITFVDSNTFF